jgi:transcriptional regulator with XRE-family HTH domain
MYQNFQDLGKALKECRQAMGLSQQDVAAQLKIRLPYIEAMEEGAFDQLPGMLYAEGHLRSYSRFLKLNEAALLESFRALSQHIEKKEAFSLPDHFSNDRRPPTAFAYAMLGLAFLVYGAWYFMHDSEASQRLPEEVVTTRGVMDEGDSSVVLLATGRAQITLYTNGQVVSSFGMQAGDTYFVPNRQDLVMYTRDAQAEDVIVDGEEVADLGALKDPESRVSLNLWQLKSHLRKAEEPAQ